ncbi:MAG TPA: hypothetical protein VGA22_01790 [Gemmatimonadales bacterium]|jgi:hypothetical protein
MLWVIVAGSVGAVGASVVYYWRERLGRGATVPIALRTLALAALVLLIVNPRITTPVEGGTPLVLVDASLSMGVAGGAWSRALDTARALTRDGGTIRRFAPDVAPWDSQPPQGGVSRIDAALAAAHAARGPTVIVTDGEIADAPSGGQPSGVRLIVLPRDTVANAALVSVEVPTRAMRRDTVQLVVSVGTWGPIEAREAVLEVTGAARLLARQRIRLAPPPGMVSVTVPVVLREVPVGDHVLRIRVVAAGDREPADDERVRITTVTEQPAVVVLIDPVDWEGRFLAATIAEVVQAPVLAFARVASERWVELASQRAVTTEHVASAAARAAAVVIRGGGGMHVTTPRRWIWPAGTDDDPAFSTGDWYVAPELPTSPIAGALARTGWASMPPATGLQFGPTEDSMAAGSWVALEARRSRRGPARPLLVLADSAGARRLTTRATGLWRWALRGGAALEAYRTLVAAGADWLLADGPLERDAPLSADPVTPRGVPVLFAWHGTVRPDSLLLHFAWGDTAFQRTVRFDAASRALVPLDTGVYRWEAPQYAASGTLAVEPFSPEFLPGHTTLRSDDGTPLERGTEIPARARWGWFLLAGGALVGEWAWRKRHGLS